MATPDIIIVGCIGNSSTTLALCSQEFITADIKTVQEEKTQLPLNAPPTYVLEKLPDHTVKPYVFSKKDLERHPFDKFINGKKRHRR